MAMEAYYRERAPEYDAFYEVAEFADDLARLRAWLARNARGRSILEIAAGTGFWTAVAAPVAKAITATDVNPEALAIARRRRLGRHVTLRPADAYALPALATTFDAAMAHMWWSHVAVQRREELLRHLASRLRPRSLLLLVDQIFAKDICVASCRRDRQGNRYDLRTLADGRTYEVIKNYPSAEQLHDSVAGLCTDVRITRLRYFWTLRARFRARPRA